MEISIAVKMEAIVGEGAIWNFDDNVLYWVDILSEKLYIYQPHTNQNQTIDIGQAVGTVVPRAGGEVILALHHGIACLDLETQKLDFWSDIESDIATNRFNDGKCDPAGRFWAGTMEFNGEKGKGSLYCMDTDHRVTKKISPVSISNGLAWSLDQKTMYYIDTAINKIMAYDYDVKTADIDNPRSVFENNKGSLDGMTIDEQGMLWVAIFGAGTVIRVNPDNGKLLQTVKIPASQVTSCALGGKNLDDLYITTARIGLDEKALAQQPLAGSLFKTNVGVQGIPAYAYEG